MKNFDEIIFNDNFKDIIADESDICTLSDLKKYIEEKISSFNDKSFSPDISEKEKILAMYGKSKQTELNNLKKNLSLLKKRLDFLHSLNNIDMDCFLNTLNEDRLSKISSGDIVFIAQKLNEKSLSLLIDTIETFKIPYIFKRNCPDFLEKDLKVLKELKVSKFPHSVSPEAQKILSSGIFDPEPNNSNIPSER